ncbi:MAG: hypothetical protein H7Y20_18190 [Bryobacteraceae bacterium]|nr:hypothetical protein [Bryobacteraceae bacterium]
MYQENASRVLGSIVIPRRNQETFGKDVEDVITRKLTLEDDRVKTVAEPYRLGVLGVAG